MKNFKMGLHDLYTALIVFGTTFLGMVAQGGSLDKSVLLSAALAGAGAVIHTFTYKGDS